MSQLLDGYVEYRDRADVGEEQAVNYFLPKRPGPKDGRTLTDLHKAAIRLGLLKRARMYAVAGKEQRVDIEYSLKDVYSYVQSILGEAQEHLPSPDTVRRFINTVREQHPTAHQLGLWGREAVERKLVYKRANKTLRPDARWQCDARDLPLYAMINGRPCPVCLLIIYDDFTKYIVHWTLIPKVTWDIHGQPRRSNFTVHDVCTLLATAMYLTGRQPDEFYTDNGSQFVALEALLPFLLNQQGKGIVLVRHKPRQPWGKGKVERALGLVNDLLSRMPGAYNKRDRETIGPARRAALPLEQVEALFAEHFAHINTRRQGRKQNLPSRSDNYWKVISAPRARFVRMAQLEVESELTWCPIDHWSFNCLGQQYEPKLNEEGTNSDIYRLWLECCASEHDARVCALKLTCGWRIEVRLRKGNEERWVEAVPKGSQDIAWEQHDHDQRASLDAAVAELEQIVEADEALVNERIGATPMVNIATGAYRIAPADKAADTGAPGEQKTSSESSEPPSAEQTSSGPSGTTTSSSDHADGQPAASSTKKQRGPRARPPKVRDETTGNGSTGKASALPDLADLPDLDALIAEVRAERS